MEKTTTPRGQKTILEKPLMGGIMVPIAIVLVGALIIFGVTKMLSTERDYRDLVRELDSKTFGNRWVSALELSKLIASGQISGEERPHLAADLSRLYESAEDGRTRNFLIVALGALRTTHSIPTLEKALEDKDHKVVFNAVVALGNLPTHFKINWDKCLPLLKSDDRGLVHVTIFSLASHRVVRAQKKITALMGHSSLAIKYAAATALIYYREPQALAIIEEILNLPRPQENSKMATKQGGGKFNSQQITELKNNVLRAMKKTRWPILPDTIKALAKNDSDNDIKVISLAREVIETLQN